MPTERLVTLLPRLREAGLPADLLEQIERFVYSWGTDNLRG